MMNIKVITFSSLIIWQAEVQDFLPIQCEVNVTLSPNFVPKTFRHIKYRRESLISFPRFGLLMKAKNWNINWNKTEMKKLSLHIIWIAHAQQHITSVQYVKKFPPIGKWSTGYNMAPCWGGGEQETIIL